MIRRCLCIIEFDVTTDTFAFSFELILMMRGLDLIYFLFIKYLGEIELL
jgi:hypothetical protein